MHRSTSGTRRACAVGTTIALVGLTTGLGVFGVQAASADTLTRFDATSVSAAADMSPTSAPTADTTTPAAPVSTSAPTAPSPTSTASASPKATTPDTPVTSTRVPTPAAATQTVTLSSTTAKVGQTLTADPNGFTGTPLYAWTREGVTVGNGASYIVKTADIGATLTVTVTDNTGASAFATTSAVTEDPQFPDTTSAAHPLELSVTAGESLSHTFAATGAPAPTYALAWADPDEGDPSDPTDDPSVQLPDGVTFDAATGVLSGIPTDADDSPYDFAVTATSGGATATEYVELTVEPGAPFGVEVYTTDKKDFDSSTGTSWIIGTDGSVETVTVSGSDFDQTVTETDGGRPTVHQGGTLVVEGDLVDRYGNATYDADGNAPMPTVTSDYATDKITSDPEYGDFGLVDVTFPHASTHHLTVSADAFSTAFAVDVVPAATTVATTTSTTPTATTATGELAFTGSETTRALPWALGLLMAGLGVTGLRIGRRRTQR
ncbi:hypothetical protein DEI92_07785 [Curtobacterium sp. MCBD17_034]|uniref:putative Ig domain-containing protein n=1 Tax=unclassified Curtobacterium TaxID=257496 RepID=UPI000DA792E0|nr:MULTISPECIES: putative Ig domain-containing protein [unclassified Curtobacterium]PZF60256.1 hypothetical protein DEI92_07785 [Curtobacterium sp. MCBD17_034]PZM34941.1 hypothetical protein DEI90_05770 [Curtobacterium sp. MCBD17_031]